ncbi:hypothetical protein [Vibrio coralliilyticus]|uniref:hypothetical protein n=1 Tax=Vibrio coralliilyticus TaxID=190893 RepID=UPI00180DE039|nr:hypothetical protein [Vibrio coralliilyticus]NUW66956.1 hypothetical protein [Vibrio coralliilyticus]
MAMLSVDIQGLDAALEQDIQTLRDNTRPAAQAMAQVFYDDVLRNVGRLNTVTGHLRGAIYQVYSPELSGEALAVYRVSWRTKRASGLPAAPHGHLIEFGHLAPYPVFRNEQGEWKTAKQYGKLKQAKFVKAHPFIRPAFLTGKAAALDAGEARLLEGFRDGT